MTPYHCAPMFIGFEQITYGLQLQVYISQKELFVAPLLMYNTRQ